MVQRMYRYGSKNVQVWFKEFACMVSRIYIYVLKNVSYCLVGQVAQSV